MEPPAVQGSWFDSLKTSWRMMQRTSQPGLELASINDSNMDDFGTAYPGAGSEMQPCVYSKVAKSLKTQVAPPVDLPRPTA